MPLLSTEVQIRKMYHKFGVWASIKENFGQVFAGTSVYRRGCRIIANTMFYTPYFVTIVNNVRIMLFTITAASEQNMVYRLAEVTMVRQSPQYSSTSHFFPNVTLLKYSKMQLLSSTSAADTADSLTLSRLPLKWYSFTVTLPLTLQAI